MAFAAETVLKLKTQFDGRGIEEARRSLAGLEREAKNIRGSIKDVIGSATWQGAAAAATGIGAGLIYSTKKAMELETQMVQVRKVVDFKSPAGLANMTADIVALSTNAPYAAKELGEIAAAAGMAGYAEKDIMKFVTAASQMGTAFNMSAKDAGDAMVAFQAGMGLTLDQALSLGDAINHLSDNLQGVVEPAALVDVTKRIGAIGVASGLSAEQVAALGAAFLAPGTASEVAATGMKNFLKALTIGAAGSESFEKAFNKIGLNSEQVAADMQTKALPTIKNVLTRIAALPKELQAGVITKIFGEESKAAIMPLLTNLKLLDQSFGLVSDRGEFAGSMQKEFKNQMNSTEAQMKIFRNTIDALAISLGQALLPGINAILAALKPFVSVLTFLTQKIPGLSTLIVGLGAAFAGLVISAPFIVSVTTLVGALSRLSVLASIAGWLGAVGPWVARLSPWLIQVASVATRIGPALTAIGPALLTFGRILVGIFSGPVGWITLLATAAVALYVFRDKLAVVFQAIGGFWNDFVVAPIRAGWAGLMAWLSQANIGAGLAAAWSTISALFASHVITPIKSLWDGFVFYVLQTVAAYAILWWQGVVAGFQTYVVTPVQGAWNGLMQWISQSVAKLGAIWNGISQAFTTQVLLPIQQEWTRFTTWVYTTSAPLGERLMGLWNGLSQGFAAKIVRPIQDLWNSVLTNIRSGWTSTTQWFGGMFSGVKNAFYNNLVAPIRNAFLGMVNGLRQIISDLLGWLRGVGNSVIDSVNRVRGLAGFAPIPRFAKGGYVNGPTLAWVGEGQDSEYVIPSRKMAGASMAYLSGARGMDVLNAGNNIRAFATGGYVRKASEGNFSEMNLKQLRDFVRTKQQAVSVTMPVEDFIRLNAVNGKINGLDINTWRRAVESGVFSQPQYASQRRAGGNTMAAAIAEGQGATVARAFRSDMRRGLSGIQNNVRAIGHTAGLQGFARGGFLKRPTLGLLAEAGDSEYVIPSARMQDASTNYLSGVRGQAVLERRGQDLQALADRAAPAVAAPARVSISVGDAPITITTGPVVESGGEQRVTIADLENAVRETRRQILGDIRTAGVRRATGRR